ncbi:putative Bis(5-adenosyl)-triphosphatase [Trypanosoma cruzi]|nr:putative Bis(5-adenosyl)-triphosphatase [Trypanosoma cruzi]
MRGAQLPAHLALCSSPCRHWIVSAGNGSDSFEFFCRSRGQMTEGHGSFPSRTPVSSHAVARFRLDHLLPGDWSRLLQHCRCLTSPGGSYNYSSPGDMAAVMRGTHAAASEKASRAVVNSAFMHIVERTVGDFFPNNMIYHELQRRYVVPSSGAIATNEGAVDFFSWLLHLQEEEEKEGETTVSCIGCGADDVGKDSLIQNALAMEKTIQNERLFLAGFPHVVGDDGKHEDTYEPIFNFFPHRVVISDCIPYRSRYFVVMVNHKPIVPGHLMVVPIRCVGTIHGLTLDEVEDWGRVMHLTIRVLKQVAAARQKNSGNTPSDSSHCNDDMEGGFSIAIQQGTLAGQTVPHLHTHVIPFDPCGKLAGEPEDEEVQQRQPCRTGKQMSEETEMLRSHFEFLMERGTGSVTHAV